MIERSVLTRSGIGVFIAALASSAGAQATDFFVLLSDGNIEDGQILRLNSSGEVESVFAPDVPAPRGTAISSNGDFFVSVQGNGTVERITPDGTRSVLLSADILGGPLAPFDLEVNSAGDLFVSNNATDEILRVDVTTGAIETFATISGTRGLGFAPDGSLFVSQAGGSISHVDPLGNVGVFAGRSSGIVEPFDTQVDSQGNVFVVNQLDPIGFTDGQVLRFGIDGTVSVFSDVDARGLAIGPDDSVFASTAAGTIVQITPDGVESVFASGLNNPFAFDIVAVPPPSTVITAAIGGLIAIRRRRN